MGLTFGFEEGMRRLRQMPDRLNDAKREALIDCALVVERRAKENITKGRPEWAPMAESTRRGRERRRGGGTARIQLLYDEGTMLRSIDHEVDETEAVIGSTIGYAAVHETGTARAGASHNIRIPARPYLVPAAEEAEEEMQEAFRERMAEAVRG